MILKISKSAPAGTVKIPGSKSHSIRAVFFASLADGVSEILDPLESSDTQSAVDCCRNLGAKIEVAPGAWTVYGFGGKPRPSGQIIDVGNSGTTLRIATAIAALGGDRMHFTGDSQIQARPMAPLLRALYELGADSHCEKSNHMAPFWIQGPIRGGKAEMEAVSSQFLTSLLIACPLAQEDTEIILTKLNERPYVEITLRWLSDLGICCENRNQMGSFYIPGRQAYKPFTKTIPADFSSATFFMVQAAISGKEIVMENLDTKDTQGDKKVMSYLRKMGAWVNETPTSIHVRGMGLVGQEIDMNDTPDALPAMAVAGCFARGETVLHNVPQARLKETDRIHVMCTELAKMGAEIKELSDGLVIRKSKLSAAPLSGHSDHRVVMALSLAAMNTEGESTIDTAEAVRVTFPEYVQMMQSLGANMSFVH